MVKTRGWVVYHLGSLAFEPHFGLQILGGSFDLVLLLMSIPEALTFLRTEGLSALVGFQQLTAVLQPRSDHMGPTLKPRRDNAEQVLGTQLEPAKLFSLDTVKTSCKWDVDLRSKQADMDHKQRSKCTHARDVFTETQSLPQLIVHLCPPTRKVSRGSAV